MNERKEIQPFTREEAKKVLQNDEWARTLGVTYSALGILLTQTGFPAELKGVVFGGLIVSLFNAARRSRGERRALEEYPGIEQELRRK